MKTILKTYLLLTVLILLTGCESTDNLEFDNTLNSKLEEVISSKNELDKTITMGFNVVFTGTYDVIAPNSTECGSLPYMVKIVNTGEGSGTYFGKLTSFFEFCVDGRDSSYPNGHIIAYFEDDNGDRLDVSAEGFVLPGRMPGMPSFATSYFKDPFVILGGTGRFEGATGSGMTNDYNSDRDYNSHHHWTGKITLPKSK